MTALSRYSRLIPDYLNPCPPETVLPVTNRPRHPGSGDGAPKGLLMQLTRVHAVAHRPQKEETGGVVGTAPSSLSLPLMSSPNLHVSECYTRTVVHRRP
jgi:hypothetical protein